MHPQPATASVTSSRTLTMQTATVSFDFVAGWLAGTALPVSLSSGVAVAVIGAERNAWARRREPQPPAEPITVRAQAFGLPHG